MSDKPKKRKVLAYVTKENNLLVFKHTDFPDAGVQVPAGSIEEGEEPINAALREVYEESGLRNVSVVNFLGVYEYDMVPYREEIQIRYVYHLKLNEPAEEKWRHYETHPDSGGEPISFDFYWVKLDTTNINLAGGQGEMLHKLVKTKQ